MTAPRQLRAASPPDENPDDEPPRFSLTIVHTLVIAMVFVFTGWLITRGYHPRDAFAITLSGLAATLLVIATGKAKALQRFAALVGTKPSGRGPT